MAASSKVELALEVAPVTGLESSDTLFKLQTDQTDLGRSGTLRNHVLTWVLDEQYDKVLDELRNYLEGESPYPDFHYRVNRYVLHGIDLVYAIKTKRNFPGIRSLTRAKQQELREKFKQHFIELQHLMTKIEEIENDMRISDARSTIYVVRALWMSTICLTVTAFIVEGFNGMGMTAFAVFDEGVISAMDWIFKHLGM